ncbi:unnamed protein product, partial [Effrenium voratum]
VLNRNLFWDSGESAYYWVPVGVTPTKTEKDKRLKRDYFVAKKFLSTAWSAELDRFMAVDYPVLCEYFELPDGPSYPDPKRAGQNERAPFRFFAYDTWRKQLKRPGKVTSTDLRGAVEQYLVDKIGAHKSLSQKRSFQAFVAHSGKTSLKHYHHKSAKGLSKELHNLYHQA